MVYKFCCYLDQLLGVDHADKYLDLVALGMIADMMDLRYFETKHLIQLGCENIRSPFRLSHKYTLLLSIIFPPDRQTYYLTKL